MQFRVNHPILFVIVGVIIAAVLAQSVYFLIKSYRRAKKIGMDMKKINKTIVSAAIFTIAPAVAIVITILALSKSLGIALPWLRLSVVGSLSYEAIAAANAASGMGKTLSELAEMMTASQYVTISIVMTVSIMVGIWLVPLIAKKMQKGLITFENKDKKWSDIIQASLFIGMISAFVGYVFSDVSRLWLSEGGVYAQTSCRHLRCHRQPALPLPTSSTMRRREPACAPPLCSCLSPFLSLWRSLRSLCRAQ